MRPSVVTAAPHGADQQPAFEGQTRAPQPAEDVAVTTNVVADGLPRLWSMEFLPDGRMLVATKDGAMHIVGDDGEPGEPLAGVPEVDAAGQGGLLDIALAPDFAESNTIFFSFAEPRGGGENGTSVVRAQLSTDDAGSGALEDVTVIFQQTPAYAGDKHFGSRLAFAPNGELFVTVGERSDTPIRDQAQDPSSGLGKIFRIRQDGSPAEGSPFLDAADAQPEIWSYGHRNLQSAVVDDEGQLWTVEHGPKGGDELNRPEQGVNYGWPVITYGVAYSGAPVGEGITAQDGMEQPTYYWDPVIGPSGMAQYQGDEFPEWQGAFLVGGLVTQGLVVLRMEDGRVATEERVPLDARIRDVKVGPDGAIYAVTESRNGGGSTIVRLTAGSES
ncbi:PQQ-dependent sugar dehydrogenase [Aurantimonas sp. A2-1-M11]